MRKRGPGWRGLLPLAPYLLLAACGGREPPRNPAQLTLVNRTGSPVHGAVLRFDRELARVDPIETGFERARLRLHPADTLYLEGGRLPFRAEATYEVAGKGGAPLLLDGVWLVNGKRGPRLKENEARLR
ncbi:MAG: hypothetical protein ACYTEZ_04915 [Planctomycetota bacterium]|jgi:hypothetical protein